MIYIIRHGQTEKNRAHSLQGRSDEPLNKQGREQAEAAADWFRSAGISFDLVYSSPLCRAVDTAKIVSGHDSVQIDRRLIEMDYGPYEGMDLSRPAPEVAVFFSDFVHNPAPKGMEQLSGLVKRAGAFMEDIKESSRGKTVLVSTHAIAMKGILQYLTRDPEQPWWSRYIGNCAVYKTEIEGNGYRIPEEVRMDILPAIC